MKVLRFLFGTYIKMWKTTFDEERIPLGEFYRAFIPAMILEIGSILLVIFSGNTEDDKLFYVALTIMGIVIFGQYIPVLSWMSKRWRDLVQPGRVKPTLLERFTGAYLYKKGYPGKNCYGPDPTNPKPDLEELEESEYFHRLSGKPGHTKTYLKEHGGWLCEGCGNENYRYVCSKCGMNQSESDALEWKNFINNK